MPPDNHPETANESNDRDRIFQGSDSGDFDGYKILGLQGELFGGTMPVPVNNTAPFGNPGCGRGTRQFRRSCA